MTLRARFLLVLLFAVLVAGCATTEEPEPAASSDDDTSAEVEDVEETDESSDEAETADEAPDEAEEAEEPESESTASGPVVVEAIGFGETHTRDPGIGGEGWTVSIDEVTTAPPLIEGDPSCLAVTGTATLDSLDEGLTSSGFSFPTINLVQDGVVNATIPLCDTSGLEASGLVASTGAEVTEGTTFQWFRTFEATQDDFDFVTVEEVVYEATGADVQVGARNEPVSAGGADDGPYQFGDAHTRDPGLGGEGWTVSIDEVTTAPPLIEGDPSCLAVTGTATLDSLDEGLTSSGFSFPTINLFQGGVVNNTIGLCDTTALQDQGFFSAVATQITEGSTFMWFATYEVTEDAFDFVAVEDTVYEQP